MKTPSPPNSGRRYAAPVPGTQSFGVLQQAPQAFVDRLVDEVPEERLTRNADIDPLRLVCARHRGRRTHVFDMQVSRLATALQAVVDAHRRFNSPVPDFLISPIGSSEIAELSERIGFPVPADLVSLYSLAGGIDLERWNLTHRGTVPYLILGWEFPTPHRSVDEAVELRKLDRNLLQQGGEPIWRDDWIPVLSNLTTGDEHIAIASEKQVGTLWHVSLELGAPRQLAHSLTTLLLAGVKRFHDLNAFWDSDRHLIDWDREAELALPVFP